MEMDRNLNLEDFVDSTLESSNWYLEGQPSHLETKDFLDDLFNSEGAVNLNFPPMQMHNEVDQQPDTSQPNEKPRNGLRDLFHAEFAQHKANKVVPTLKDEGGCINIDISDQICHDKDVNKIYTKPKEPLNLVIKYRQRLEDGECFTLCTLVYKTQPVAPVHTCANHRDGDSATDEQEKYNALRCRNKDATYVGTQAGTHLDDRLSVLVPLYYGKPDLNQFNETALGLEFVCQNSCLGRKEMCLILYLLNSKFEVLGNKVLDVKVCACPKRDMKKDQSERTNGSKTLKRRKDLTDPGDIPIGKKLLKVEMDRESGYGSDFKLPTSGVRMVMDLPDMDVARHVLQCALNAIAGQITSDPSNPLVGVWKQQWAQLQEQKKKCSAPL